MTQPNISKTSSHRQRRSPVAAAFLLTATVCLSGCQRFAQELPVAPIFVMGAPPRVLPKPVAAPLPPPQPPAPPQFQPFTGPTTISFEAGRTDLDAAARMILDRQAEWLLRNPLVTAELQGHASLAGTRKRQFAIGEMRASAMARYLVLRGVSPDRLRITSFGKLRPAANGFDEQSQQRNRRGETIFRGVAQF